MQRGRICVLAVLAVLMSAAVGAEDSDRIPTPTSKKWEGQVDGRYAHFITKGGYEPSHLDGFSGSVSGLYMVWKYLGVGLIVSGDVGSTDLGSHGADGGTTGLWALYPAAKMSVGSTIARVYVTLGYVFFEQTDEILTSPEKTHIRQAFSYGFGGELAFPVSDSLSVGMSVAYRYADAEGDSFASNHHWLHVLSVGPLLRMAL